MTIDAPRRNALSSELVDELAEQLDAAERRHDRVVALAARGPAFCGGFDLREPLDDRSAARRFAAIEALLARVRRAPFVTVACVHGPAHGAGADLVAACDYRVATASARFRFPGSRFGLVLGVRRLAAILGDDVARDLILRAPTLDAEQAHALRLVTHVVGDDELTPFVERLAADVADLDRETLCAVLAATRGHAVASDSELLVRSAHRGGIATRIASFAPARTSSSEKTS